MTANLPLVAVITPVYNGSPWLERTMACVQRQTYPNVVHIVLDNASADDTPQVIKRYLGQKVPVITARNPAVLQQPENWNAAFRMTPADAKYVMLLCADDLIRADALQKLVDRAEEDPAIVLVSAGNVTNDRVGYPHPPAGKLIIDGWDMIRSVLDHSYNHFAWQCFFARCRPEDAQEDYFSVTKPCLDSEKLMRLMEIGKVGFILEPLIYTRVHDLMMSARIKKRKIPSFRLFRWQAAVAYAKRAFEPERAERCLREEKYFVMRFEFLWRLVGAKEAADELRRFLTDAGYPPQPLEYVWAFLHYPYHKIRQTKVRAAAEGILADRLQEDEFTAYA